MALASMDRAFKGIEQYPGKKGQEQKNSIYIKGGTSNQCGRTNYSQNGVRTTDYLEKM